MEQLKKIKYSNSGNDSVICALKVLVYIPDRTCAPELVHVLCCFYWVSTTEGAGR